MKTIGKQSILDTQNSKVIKENGGDDASLSIENSQKNHEKLNTMGILFEIRDAETIRRLLSATITK